MERVMLFNDHFQNYKRHNIPKAQLLIADIPYNVGINAFASSPEWYIDDDNKRAITCPVCKREPVETDAIDELINLYEQSGFNVAKARDQLANLEALKRSA